MHTPTLRCLLEDLESTAAWPEDFQVLLFQLLEPLGYEELPPFISVKSVPIDNYLAQAIGQDYEPGDSRNRPEYQADLRSYISDGGSLPPIIVRGDELLDGRHRLLGMIGTREVRAIDLNELIR